MSTQRFLNEHTGQKRTDEERLRDAHEALRLALLQRRRLTKAIAGHRAVINYLRSERKSLYVVKP